jgi:hypothetical protein
MKWPTDAAVIECPYCDTKISLPVTVREHRMRSGSYYLLLDLGRAELDKHEDGRCLS